MLTSPRVQGRHPQRKENMPQESHSQESHSEEVNDAHILGELH